MLTPEQQAEFRRCGILRIPGAISARATAAMCDAVWEMLALRNYKIRRDDGKTWPAQRIMGTKERPKAITVAQIVNPTLRANLDQLLAPEKWDCDQHWGSLLVSFPGAFPEAPNGWDVPHAGWHFDAPMVRALPDLYGVRMFACLAEVAPRGGATLALAGSPRLAHVLANARGLAKLRSADLRNGLMQRYEWINELCSHGRAFDRVERFMQQGTTLEDVEVRVVEMTGEPGDVYLVHPVMMHAASPNCLATPRIVLSSTVYQRGADWSALYGAEREAAA